VKIAHSIAEAKSWPPLKSAVTLGVFDGVHIGHERIVTEVVRSRQSGAVDSCYLVTFDPHPLSVTHSKMTPPMLTTLDERIHLLGRFDIDGVVVLRFDDELANVDYRRFLQKYLFRSFNMKLLILGYDCYFGRNREGSPERVQEECSRIGVSCKVVPAVRNNDEAISSTKIRNALMEGDLSRANRLLGHPYLISGTVVRGHGKGCGLGFATANLSIDDPYKLWPPLGVYAVRVEYKDETMGGMMNVGRAPTMKSLAHDAREIEVHLFDFDEDIYGERLRVFCMARLRDERRFASAEALASQLEVDKMRALECLGKAP